MMGEFRKALFSRVVPTVKDIGLWGDKVQKAYADMGVIDFQDTQLCTGRSPGGFRTLHGEFPPEAPAIHRRHGW
jgi:hypothetical protein